MSETQRVVYAKEAQLLYTDTTAKRLFTLPSGALILRVTCITRATSTNATLSVGTASSSTKYVSAGSVSTAQVSEMTVADSDELTATEDIYGLIGGSPSSGGPFDVIVEFTSIKSTGPK